MPTEEIQLLRDYAATRSQAAFAQVAQRYVDLVYAAARRQVRGDAHLAEDVTQAVFIILAEKAAKVPADRPLSAWLLKTTAYCAANARRSKTHREHYERRAAQMARANEVTGDDDDDATWDELSPLLDEGLNKLRPQDRDAVLLKFFEKKSLRQIGEALGISEEAAGKRVARAVDRLRGFFRRRGVAVSAAALPVLLMSNASHAAPAAVVSAVVATTATTAATTAATTSGAAAVAKGALAVMAAEKAKALALAAAVLIVGVGGGAVLLKTVLSPVSNEKRQVAVGPSAVAGMASPAVNNAWAMRLPDGTLVELLGITDAALGPDQWWTLDGSPVPPPADYQPGLVTIPQTPGTRAIQLVMRFVDVPPQAPRSVIVRPNAAGGATATSDRGGARLTYHVTLVGADQDAADLIVGRGSPGNVIELQNISLRPGHNPGLRLVPSRRSPANADARVSAAR